MGAELIVAIVGTGAGVVGTGAAIWALILRPRIKATAYLDAANRISVQVHAAGRSSVTITAVRPIVSERRGRKPAGNSQPVLKTTTNTFTGAVHLAAQQDAQFTIQLAMTEQSLPASDGSANRVERRPDPGEIWVQIDYGKDKRKFVRPSIEPDRIVVAGPG